MGINKEKILDIAYNTLKLEANAILNIIDSLNDAFVEAVKLIHQTKGRVIITGIGKSGLIAKKIAATFTSTGTPSLFLHTVEAIHGDLGIVSKDDIVLAISKSGAQEEFQQLIPALKRHSIKIIAITNEINSYMAKNSDVVLLLNIKQEACPHNLAPTVSTTVTLALGDALAIALLECKDFRIEDFAILHPGGSLGKKLTLRVSDLMLAGEQIPKISIQASFQETLLEMTGKRMGITCIVDNKKLVGVLSDGDLRRLLEQQKDVFSLNAIGAMKSSARNGIRKFPKVVTPDAMAVETLAIMEKYEITVLVVVNEILEPVGMIELYDLLKAGLA